MNKNLVKIAGVLLAATLLSLSAWAGKDPLGVLKGLKVRSIGPAGMSGRVTAIDVDPRNRNVIYVGSASGGLWKSSNGGITWQPLFDEQPVASIGAVAVDPTNPDIVWVGSGEGNPRNSQTVGNGIYKSLDGGRTWQHLGLEETEHIHRVLIHPHNPDVVFVAALGRTWSDGEERGVFRTRDGGRSWEKVLYVNERTGAAELVMDPRNPNKLLAAMWEHRRWPWFFKSGGPGSGLYVTLDGGDHWEKRTEKDGLPAGELGRIGLAIAPSRPEVIYALVEAKKNGLYRSDDGGYKWRLINDEDNVANRPFYYADIRVDPHNENRLYSLHSRVTVSEDGGKSFELFVPFRIHPDHHAMWIDPQDPNYIIEGNDGGLAISRDRGKSWRFVENLPLGQFYHVNVDRRRPYFVYGGLQDNGSYRGPAYVWARGGMVNAYWQEVGFGDGFDVLPDASDPRYLYSMSQGGNLRRFDTLTGESKTIRPPDPEGVELRFNWNAALAGDPFDPGTIYYGSQFVHRSRDRGNSWEIISPDLTTNDPQKQRQLDSGGLTYDVTGAENHTTILTIAPSPVQRGVIWVGTDDGNVQVTRDDGKTWTNVRPNIPQVPAHTWVPHIEASKFHAGEAFVVFDNHRRGDWTPYVLHTSDFGKTWTSLVTDELRGYVHVIEQDNKVENLLFLGTEFHLYFSLDKGRSWHRWEGGLPTVAVRDLAVQPDEGDLVIATFGRSLYVLDDIGPLRSLAEEGVSLLEKTLHLFPIPDAVQAIYQGPPGMRFPGDAEFAGDNRPQGALITYVVNPAREKEEASQSEQEEAQAEGSRRARGARVRLEILDGQGEVIRTLQVPGEAGLHRVYWELDRKGVRFPSDRPAPRRDQEPGGPPVLPGQYTVRLTLGKESTSQPVQVLFDPRRQVSPEDLQAKDALVRRFMGLVETTTQAYEQLREARQTLDKIRDLLGDRPDEGAKSLQGASREIRRRLEELAEQVIPKPVQGIRRDPKLLSSQLFRASSYVQSGWDAPNDSDRQVLAEVEEKVRRFVEEVNRFFAEEWERYRRQAEEAELSLFKDFPPVRF